MNQDQAVFQNTIRSLVIVDDETLIATEQLSVSLNSIKIYFLLKDDKNNTYFGLKLFRAIHVRFPYIIWIHGSKELWILNVK